jgi:SAM-dependent methyltransferase
MLLSDSTETSRRLRRLFNEVQYRFLKRIAPTPPRTMTGKAYEGKSKLRVCCPGIETEVKDKVVLDFGCGPGVEARELARLGAKRVVGFDISRKWLQFAQQQAEQAGVARKCEFVSSLSDRVEVILSLDCFEHFAQPQAVLQNMFDILEPGGTVFITFGPTWYHPLGGHLFSVFPWAHILLSEEALIRWRAQFKTDRATRFSEVEGGLNRLTIRRFEEIVTRSPFELEKLEMVPIRRLRLLHNRLTREFLTAIVRCELRKPYSLAVAA